MQKAETIQSAVSYSVASAGVATVSLVDQVVGAAETVTILVAYVAVIARASYDIIRLIRYITNTKEQP